MSKGRRLVVKLGTGVLTQGVGRLDLRRMSAVCAQVAEARREGFEVVLVSSGAVGLGMGQLGIGVRPKKISSVQKCAAVGQGILIQTWGELFRPHSITVAQILITRDDLDVRQRHKAMRELLDELLACGIVPIINENDCVSAAELNIKFGDNDVLSALVAVLCKADSLVILSTAEGLVDIGGTNKVIPLVEKITPEIRAKALGTKSATAVGGMVTKIKAAEIATSSGCQTHIASGLAENSLIKIIHGENIGTLFTAALGGGGRSSRKRWLAYFGRSIGKIYVDGGAADALRKHGSSLLPAGVLSVAGRFQAGSLVEIVDSSRGFVVARGLAEKSSEEISALAAAPHSEKCGHKEVVVHRDNLAIV